MLRHHQRILQTWLVFLGVGNPPFPRERGGKGCQCSDVPVGRDNRGEVFGGVICLQAGELEGVGVGIETTCPGQQFEVLWGGM